MIRGEAGSGVICLNGAAARLVAVGDHVIIMSYCTMSPEEAKGHKPDVVLVGEDNTVFRTISGEEHGPEPTV